MYFPYYHTSFYIIYQTFAKGSTERWWAHSTSEGRIEYSSWNMGFDDKWRIANGSSQRNKRKDHPASHTSWSCIPEDWQANVIQFDYTTWNQDMIWNFVLTLRIEVKWSRYQYSFGSRKLEWLIFCNHAEKTIYISLGQDAVWWLLYSELTLDPRQICFFSRIFWDRQQPIHQIATPIGWFGIWWDSVQL